eukprot:459630-Hanusia_phi.AAC.1
MATNTVPDGELVEAKHEEEEEEEEEEEVVVVVVLVEGEKEEEEEVVVVVVEGEEEEEEEEEEEKEEDVVVVVVVEGEEDLRDCSSKQIRSLVDAGADEETAVTSSVDCDLGRASVALLDEILRCGLTDL